MKLRSLLFTTIFIEGYAVLAVELLTIRQLIPFVGSGTETISVAIAAVLLPLAIGYYAGGRYKKSIAKGKEKSIRRKLLKNIMAATYMIAIGLSYILMELYFETMRGMGITNRILQTAIYCSVFIVYPIYLLGQTIPLVSNYFSHDSISEMTGKMLFFSTTGSFLGAVFSTLVLMSVIGVHNTVLVVVGLLVILYLLLSRRKISASVFAMMVLFAIAFGLNNKAALGTLNIVENNNYNQIAILDYKSEKSKGKIMSINRSSSSKLVNNEEDMFNYWLYVEDKIISFTDRDISPKKSILVVGAAGFTIGMNDLKNDYTYIDIDPSMQEVAEKYFLGRELNPNQKFIAEPARAFFRNNEKKFDLIVLDAYTNFLSIPQEMVTEEFFRDVKSALSERGILAMNSITRTDFSDVYAVRLDNTFRRVFPVFNRIPLEDFNPWKDTLQPTNVMYVYYNRGDYYDEYKGSYTDDKNTYFWDQGRSDDR